MRPLNLVREAHEGDSLYELRDDLKPQTSTKTTNKRKLLSPKGQVTSQMRISEHEDGGDIYNNGVALDEPLLKRNKKLSISKRSQSMSIRLTNDTEWLKGGADVAYCGEGKEGQGSGLTLHLVSFPRKPGRAGSAASKSKGRQTSAFMNSKITKQQSAGRRNLRSLAQILSLATTVGDPQTTA